jgi:hypothetical protein
MSASAHDKRPYKTEVGIQFRHAGDDDVHAPSFYLHLAPGDVFAGAGIWRPGGAGARRAARRDRRLAGARGAARRRRAASRERWALRSEFLQRMPRGYDPIIVRRRPAGARTSSRSRASPSATRARPTFAERLAEAWRASAPLMRFLTGHSICPGRGETRWHRRCAIGENHPDPEPVARQGDGSGLALAADHARERVPDDDHLGLIGGLLAARAPRRRRVCCSRWRCSASSPLTLRTT